MCIGDMRVGVYWGYEFVVGICTSVCVVRGWSWCVCVYVCACMFGWCCGLLM